MDFKSSEIHTQDAADKRVRNNLQLAIYAMAYARMFEVLPDTIELHFLESGLVGSARMSEKRLAKTEEKILKASLGIRNRDYTAKPGYQACRYCAYAEICPSAVRT